MPLGYMLLPREQEVIDLLHVRDALSVGVDSGDGLLRVSPKKYKKESLYQGEKSGVYI